MNPFSVTGFSKGKYFCDRKLELKKLQDSFKNNRNVTLISLRRMGKSSLINYHFEKLKNIPDCLYIDIFPAQNLNEFISIFANSIYSNFGKSFKQHLKELTSLVKSLGATLSFNELSGSPEINFGLNKPQKSEKNLKELISFLEKRRKRVLIAFDEFQQILNFEEKNVENILRTNFQGAKNINFIYSGSDKGMMESLFSSHSKPFYQSTEFLYLYEIERSEYREFIIRHFKEGKLKISEAQVDFILDVCRNHTYYIQYFCNRLYSINFNGNQEVLIKTFYDILIENEPIYISYKKLLTNIQWNIVRAIALEGSVKEPLANKFLSKYRLGSTSTAQRSLESLIKSDQITWYRENLIVNDVYFHNWLRMKSV